MSNEVKRLYRSRTERMIGGVCGGLGQFLGIDPTIIRLTFFLVTLVLPITPLLYLTLMLLIPDGPLDQV